MKKKKKKRNERRTNTPKKGEKKNFQQVIDLKSFLIQNFEWATLDIHFNGHTLVATFVLVVFVIDVRIRMLLLCAQLWILETGIILTMRLLAHTQ